MYKLVENKNFETVKQTLLECKSQASQLPAIDAVAVGNLLREIQGFTQAQRLEAAFIANAALDRLETEHASIRRSLRCIIQAAINLNHCGY